MVKLRDVIHTVTGAAAGGGGAIAGASVAAAAGGAVLPGGVVGLAAGIGILALWHGVQALPIESKAVKVGIFGAGVFAILTAAVAAFVGLGILGGAGVGIGIAIAAGVALTIGAVAYFTKCIEDGAKQKPLEA